MYCPSCGRQNSGGASFCNHCGERLPGPDEQPTQKSPPVHQTQVPVRVSNYLAQAILVTIFCCWPFGIPAIVYSAQANARAAQGDFSGAQAAASNALTWCWVSFSAGLLAMVIYAIFMISAAATVPFY